MDSGFTFLPPELICGIQETLFVRVFGDSPPVFAYEYLTARCADLIHPDFLLGKVPYMPTT